MEHRNLALEYDKNLIDKILDSIDMKYIIIGLRSSRMTILLKIYFIYL